MDSDQTLQRNLHREPWANEAPPEAIPEEALAVDPLAIEPFVRSADPTKFDLLLWLHLLWRHPLVFWGGIWVMLLLVMGIAITSLMSPELSKQDHSNDAIAVQPTLAREDGQQTVPMWSLAAIALSCALGSILISQRLKQTNHEKRSLKAKSKALALSSHLPTDGSKDVMGDTSYEHLFSVSQPSGAQPSVSQPIHFSAQPLSHSTSTSPTSPEKGSALGSNLSNSNLSNSNGSSRHFQESPTITAVPAAVTPATVVPATVVPADESTPLDWEDAGLAELMDIRYRRNR